MGTVEGQVSDAVYSKGIMGVWGAWQEKALGEKRQYEREMAAYKEKFKPGAPYYEESIWGFKDAIAKCDERRAKAPMLWMQLTGFSKKTEREVSPGERANGIRRLLKAVQRVTKFELEAELSRRGGEWLGVNSEDPDACFAWDPLRAVCFHFGLAKTTLGSWAWEVWGLSGPQIADRLKCAGVDKKMRDEMREFVHGFLRERDDEGRRNFQKISSDAYWAWKKAMRGQAFNTTRAANYGFTSYSRFGRACVLCFGLEPAALEWRVVQELVREFFSRPVEKVSEQGAAVERSEVKSEKAKVKSDDGGSGALKEGEVGR